MTNIDKYVEHLKNPDKNKRYDACEELRVASDLPEKAVLALQETMNDPDPDVADAAQRAFALHTEKNKELVRNNQIQNKIELPLTNWNAVNLGIKSGLIALVIFFVIFSFLGFLYGMAIAFFYCNFMGVLGGIIGALIGKYWKNTWYATHYGCLLGTFLGIGLWNLLIVLLDIGIGLGPYH